MDVTSLKQLEDAARAAGYEPIRLTDDGTALLLEGIQQPWNPRDENPHSDCMGDALRLAVTLRLDISPQPDGKVEVSNQWDNPEELRWAWEAYGDDAQAATRRAIVKAAAEIGKGMK